MRGAGQVIISLAETGFELLRKRVACSISSRQLLLFEICAPNHMIHAVSKSRGCQTIEVVSRVEWPRSVGKYGLARNGQVNPWHKCYLSGGWECLRELGLSFSRTTF